MSHGPGNFGLELMLCKGERKEVLYSAMDFSYTIPQKGCFSKKQFIEILIYDMQQTNFLQVLFVNNKKKDERN